MSILAGIEGEFDIGCSGIMLSLFPWALRLRFLLSSSLAAFFVGMNENSCFFDVASELTRWRLVRIWSSSD